MRIFNIQRPDAAIRKALIDKIDNLTKPKGSLGRLEELALQIGLIQQSLTPTLSHPCNVLFAADHGIERENVSCSPREVTWQQLSNFLHGGAGINFLCRQHGFELILVDAGVDYKLPYEQGIINASMGHGTGNFLYEPTMTQEEAERCIDRGAKIMDDVYRKGCNVVSFGEMGIGNTSASSMWLHEFTKTPIAACVGAGSGLSDAGIRHKIEVMERAAQNRNRDDDNVLKIMAYYGGFEMVMAVGAMLRAAELGMVILVDGFIMTACMMGACRLQSDVKEYAIFCHQGDERAHQLMLKDLNVKPLLNLGLRLGEGSGAVCAYPIVESAVKMINEMDNFQHAAITKYF